MGRGGPQKEYAYTIVILVKSVDSPLVFTGLQCWISLNLVCFSLVMPCSLTWGFVVTSLLWIRSPGFVSYEACVDSYCCSVPLSCSPPWCWVCQSCCLQIVIQLRYIGNITFIYKAKLVTIETEEWDCNVNVWFCVCVCVVGLMLLSCFCVLGTLSLNFQPCSC